MHNKIWIWTKQNYEHDANANKYECKSNGQHSIKSSFYSSFNQREKSPLICFLFIIYFCVLTFCSGASSAKSKVQISHK